jgi:hypothetical protein
MRSLEIRTLLVLFLYLSARVASADPVAIVNAGFEEPVMSPGAFTVGLDPPGWTFIGTTRRGVWNISNNPNGWFQFGAPEGNQIGALWEGSFVQTLGVALAPNTTYTLQAEYMHVPCCESEFTIELLAGGVSLGSTGGLLPLLLDGTFYPAEVVVTTGATHPQLGEPLVIRISSTAAEAEFDNIRLNTDTIVVDPCVALGGDVDGDGICGAVDNCPNLTNPDQSDIDTDGIGDVCDSHEVLAANTTYTLQGEYTHASGFPSEFTLELLAGAASLGSAGGFPTIVGAFDTATIVVTTGSTHPNLGEPIGVRISSSAKESEFDNIRLNANTMGTDRRVAIANAGFEVPMQAPGAFTIGEDPPGWTFIGTTRRGVWNISNNPNGWFPNLAPEGDQVGALWAGSFVQTLEPGPCAALGGDTDGDGVCDDADNCPNVANPDQSDFDSDGIGDVCDADSDGDGIADGLDNCQFSLNPDQSDADFDGLGDVCDDDPDGDGVIEMDNCPLVPNQFQEDTDLDGTGDDCDEDDDNDGICDVGLSGESCNAGPDNCSTIVNPDQANLDNDSFGDACDADTDGDGIDNDVDNCELSPNVGQNDTDSDSEGDACDDDDDGDGVLDVGDNCQFIINPSQQDTDGDALGDACDADFDGDGVDNAIDNCPTAPNSEQNDLDGDAIGDSCDTDIDGDGVENGADVCAATPIGDVVDLANGCSIAQFCPCDGPRGTTSAWKNHGKYVSCTAHAASEFVEEGLISDVEKDAILSAAGQSSCGNKKYDP